MSWLAALLGLGALWKMPIAYRPNATSRAPSNALRAFGASHALLLARRMSATFMAFDWVAQSTLMVFIGINRHDGEAG